MHKLAILLRITFLLLLTPVSLLFAQTITVSPAEPSVGLGGTVQLTATASGLSSNMVTWSVQGGASSGTVSSSGLYTAPNTMPGQVPVSVVATSTSNSSITGIAYVNLLTAGPHLTSVSPNPLVYGTVTVTLSGTGFLQGANVVATTNGSPVQFSTTSVTSTSITATGYQGPASSVSFTVVNPGSVPSNAVSVPVTGGFALNVVNGSGSGSYAAGSTITIKANSPGANQTFLDWTGAAVANATASTTTLTMPSANTTVTANYSGKYTLTVVNGTGSGTYQNGTTVAITANAAPSGQWFGGWTGATVANSTSPSTTLVMPGGNTTVTASYYTPPTIPYPVTTHPRIWVTPTDVTRLRSWATASNPIYKNGMQPLLATALNVYNTQFFPNGQPNPNYPDPGDTQGYTGYLTEQYGAILAFNSLIDPNPANRILYAQDTRNLLMYAMNQAALGQATGQPFRDPMFATYNRANGSGEQWILMVDWIYNAVDGNNQPILTSSDKATIQKVFLMWANSCLNASTAYGDHPVPVGTTNSLALLPNNQPYRMASNNYYLGHARMLTMMGLVMDPADDPSVNSNLPPSTLGNSIRSYILDANGAWLYQEYAMMGEQAKVAQQYGITGTGAGLGLASGGLPPEGMLYGHSYGFILGQLLALQTAGFNNTAYSGPQIGLIGAPVWDRFVQGFISSLTPQGQTFASQSYLGPVYQMHSFGDLLRLWITPDFMQPFSLLSLLEGENGSTQHRSAATWFAVNATEGGSGALMSRITQPFSYGSTASILYYMLLAPGYNANTDPRPSYPTTFVDPGAGRLVSHSDWSATNSVFDYRASWESINHQQGDAGSFELFRNGEWLTKPMSNYDNNLVGFTPTYLNSLGLKNWCPNGTPNLSWFETGEWANGGQWILADNAGDPTTRTSYGSGYAFADSDLTNLYNRPDAYDANNAAMDIEQATRSILWLNRDYIVVYDRATSDHDGLFKTFNLSLVNKPTTVGSVTTEVNPSGQKLFIQTLLPTSPAITSFNGAANLNPVAMLEPTQYVLTIQDPNLPSDTRFLHVLQGASSTSTMSKAVYSKSTAGGAFEGAMIGSIASFFPVKTGVSFQTTTFVVANGISTLYLAGLTPGGSYTVTSTSGPSGKTIVVSAGTGVAADSAGLLKTSV